MAGAAAGVSTAAEWVDFAVAEWVDFTVAAVSTGVDLADFTVTSRVCTTASASGTRVFRGRHGAFIGGLGLGFYGYPYGWDYSPDYGYSGYSQPYAAQNWYYCSDPAGYYPYVTQCNTGWQAVPAN